MKTEQCEVVSRIKGGIIGLFLKWKCLIVVTNTCFFVFFFFYVENKSYMIISGGCEAKNISFMHVWE